MMRMERQAVCRHGVRKRKSGIGPVCAMWLLSAIPVVLAQAPSAARESGPGTQVSTVVETVALSNASSQGEQNEILTAIRNILNPSAKVFLVPSTNVIAINASAEQVALTRRLVRELDVPRKAFRLTYTLTESEAGKRVGVQHFSMTLVDGQRNTMKQGSRVPISTAQPSAALTSPAQVAYIDVGLSFDATLSSIAGGAMLKTKVEQSSVADEKSNVGIQDPVIRQVLLEGVSKLVAGQPLMLGSMDVPSSTRHVDVEVVAEPVK